MGKDVKPLPANLNDIDHSWEYRDDEIVFWFETLSFETR